MSTLNVEDQTAIHPDGWQRELADGSYDWWYFDAVDTSGESRGEPPLTVVGIVYCGFPFTSAYYRRPNATRAQRDPAAYSRDPLDHTAVSLTITRGDAVLATGVHEFSRRHFEADDHQPRVRVGPNAITPNDDGSLTLAIEMQSIPLGVGFRSRGFTGHTSLKLSFSPLVPPAMERPWVMPAGEGRRHRWFPAMPACRVEGSVAIRGETTHDIAFDGVGYHDHNSGNAPLDVDFADWFWGRVAGSERSLIVYDAAPPSKPTREQRLDVWDGQHWQSLSGWRTTPLPTLKRDKGRFAPFFPNDEQLEGDGVSLTLSGREIIEFAPFYIRQLVHVQGEVAGVAFDDLAVTERLKPSRLRRGIVQCMLRTRLQYWP